MMEQKANNRAAAEQFASEFGGCFGTVITQTCNFEVKFVVQGAPDLSKRHGEPGHFRVSVNDAEHGECFIEIYRNGIEALGSKILREDGPSYERCREAVEATVGQAVLELQSRLQQTCGEVNLKVDRVSDLVFGGMFVVPLQGLGLDCEMPILLYFSSGFGRALAGKNPAYRSSKDGAQIAGGNIDLVMDVELNVTLRFGQRQMPLRDVLELESGSVIELDRRVDDPVELLLDGKVIALGEAVIVDGNYGLRVTKISEPIGNLWK